MSNQIRTDARTGDAKAYGIRNAHRGMGGQIIGGVTAGGQAFGTKAGQGQSQGQSQAGPSWKQPMPSPGAVSATPRLDAGVQTPGIDSMRGAATAGESFAQTDVRKRQESAASGAFGKGAQIREGRRQNIAGRQALYADMKSAGQAGITAEMEARGTALGVSGPAWKRTAGSIDQAAGQKPTAPVQATPGRTPLPAGTGSAPSIVGAPGTKAPVAGKALAQSNIASMGTMGAIADYQKRSAADKQAQAAKKSGFLANAPSQNPMAPMAKDPRSFTQAAGVPAAVPTPPQVASAGGPKDPLKRAGFRASMVWQGT